MKKKLFIIAPLAVILSLALIIGIFFMPPSSKEDETAQGSSLVQSENSSLPSSSETISSELTEPEPEPEKFLSVTNPAQTDTTVNTPAFTLRGSGDPAHPLTLNGEKIALDKDGLFSVEMSLKEGANTFTFSHKGKTVTYTVRYKKVIIKSVYPSSTITVKSGGNFNVSVVALKNSEVSATFNGKTIKLNLAKTEDDSSLSEYSTYVGNFGVPKNTDKLKNYGNVKFSVVSPSGNATLSGGKIKVSAEKTEAPSVGTIYPPGSTYKNVGNTLIAEVICDSAETFDGDDTVDTSRPTNNYLPRGTVDYCSPNTREYFTGTQTVTLHTLRYGNQVYEKTKNSGTNIKVYKGTLPETNKVSLDGVRQSGNHTVMTFNVDWKAPFRFDLKPQGYASPGKSNVDYRVQNVTFQYVEIVFCYAESLSFDFDFKNHPVFSRYEIKKGENDYVLKLYLRKKGKFYGWSAKYNSKGQLEFRFLCPAYLTPAKNEYGYSLDGITILIDAGHGGRDPGAAGFVANKNESQLNLILATTLKKKLEALGAEVIMTRSDDSYIEVVDRMSGVRKNRPDFAISIHRDASSSSSPNGFASYYFNPFSAEAAKYIFNATSAANIYQSSNWEGTKWHYFFLCRNTECPVVLTENGFITNRSDYTIMTDKNEACAKALVDGIMKYFITNRRKTKPNTNSASNSSSSGKKPSSVINSSSSKGSVTSTSSSTSTSVNTSSSTSASSNTSTSSSATTSSNTSTSSSISSSEAISSSEISSSSEVASSDENISSDQDSSSEENTSSDENTNSSEESSSGDDVSSDDNASSDDTGSGEESNSDDLSSTEERSD